jgi:ABC-2 type transport system ATP-binding protein
VHETAIQVRDLRKSYGPLEAVKGLSFEVRRGEVFGLLGPNGAGKTTTVEILEGYRERSGGEVSVLGFDPAHAERSLKERVGIVLQEMGFYPNARRTAWTVIRTLRELGKTVMLTTHYLDEAQELADRVAIVKDGVIIAQGPPAELRPGRAAYRVAYDDPFGRRVEIETDDPTELLHRLTSDALERGERLENLTVSRPTLEDVYLELTAEEESAALTPEAVR